MKTLLILAVCIAFTGCSNLSGSRGHAEYSTPPVTVYSSPKVGRIAVAAVVTYDAPEEPAPISTAK